MVITHALTAVSDAGRCVRQEACEARESAVKSVIARARETLDDPDPLRRLLQGLAAELRRDEDEDLGTLAAVTRAAAAR
jgi:hypothetical protein